MLHSLRDLFNAVTAPPAAESEREHEHMLQLATAVLLVEVMRSDPEIGAAERDTVVAALREKFALGDDEVARLVELAERTSEDANDFHRFTSRLNKGFDVAQRVRIVEYMWQVAYADGQLSAHENHLMRKIAALLYVPHADYIAAKMRAREHSRRAVGGGTARA